ncbi:XTP/dITP diphosphohydrolase [Granulicella rosea]|uniref:dITP/XTP pyrophosphatase n=1 Tax=Granulicella rosea TaxID=474952 RepID=A0A239IRR6_9BACT|nr:non-canonical purine NTP pyrophosphatase [Granulicella rosea]SNS96241.1 XTP/dITP diphosphohydrolase [Granulicella rosea]
MILYVATTNPGKLRDFAAAATPGVTIAPLPNIASIPAPDETADTFEGNARIKALAYSAIAPGQIVLADDSGIELDALGGAPGVRSARYADDEGFPATPGVTTDQRNLACLLDRTRHLTGEDRYARYRCVLIAARDGEVIAIGTGDVDGILLDTPTGNGGFGYDPIFLISEHDETMAELDIETRLSLSHRGRALADLLAKLKSADFA